MNADFRIVAVMLGALASCTAPPPEPPPKEVYGPELPPPKKPTPNQIDGRLAGTNYHCAAIANKGHNSGFTFFIKTNDSSGEWRIVETSTVSFFTHKATEVDALTVGVISRSEKPMIYNNDKIVEPEFALAATLAVKRLEDVCREWRYHFMNNDTTLNKIDVKSTVSPAQLEIDQRLIASVYDNLQLSELQDYVNSMGLRPSGAAGLSPR